MTNTELKIAHQSMIIERNYIKDDLRAYIVDYLQNVKPDNAYNKGFIDALKVLDNKIKEI